MTSVIRTILLENRTCSYCEFLHEDDLSAYCARCSGYSHFAFNETLKNELAILEEQLKYIAS